MVQSLPLLRLKRSTLFVDVLSVKVGVFLVAMLENSNSRRGQLVLQNVLKLQAEGGRRETQGIYGVLGGPPTIYIYG